MLITILVVRVIAISSSKRNHDGTKARKEIHVAAAADAIIARLGGSCGVIPAACVRCRGVSVAKRSAGDR
jgi:hypothetical protein